MAHVLVALCCFFVLSVPTARPAYAQEEDVVEPWIHFGGRVGATIGLGVPLLIVGAASASGDGDDIAATMSMVAVATMAAGGVGGGFLMKSLSDENGWPRVHGAVAVGVFDGFVWGSITGLSLVSSQFEEDAVAPITVLAPLLLGGASSYVWSQLYAMAYEANPDWYSGAAVGSMMGLLVGEIFGVVVSSSASHNSLDWLGYSISVGMLAGSLVGYGIARVVSPDPRAPPESPPQGPMGVPMMFSVQGAW